MISMVTSPWHCDRCPLCSEVWPAEPWRNSSMTIAEREQKRSHVDLSGKGLKMKIQ